MLERNTILLTLSLCCLPVAAQDFSPATELQSYDRLIGFWEGAGTARETADGPAMRWTSTTESKKVLGDLTTGQVLKVMATDPGSVKDFQAFCKQTGNELLSHSEGPEFTFFMKKR